MNGLALICTALTISAGAAALAACGGSQPPIGAPGATVSDTPFSLSVGELRSIEEAWA
jgi:hypothetical protein